MPHRTDTLQQIDGVAALLVLLGIGLIVLGMQVGWALIVLGILKQYAR